MSTGVGVSECCLSGNLHSGTPKGHEEEINGLSTYVSPSPDQGKTKSVVIISDVFGYKLPNTRLFADEVAKAGFFVYVPDFLQGDPIDISFLDDVEPNLNTKKSLSTVDKGVKSAKVATTLGTWLPKHTEGKVKPLIEGFINSIRTPSGMDKVGTIGFCWGGRYSILMAHGQVDAAVAYHPSLVSVPADFDPVTKPLTLAVGDQDSLLSNSEVDKIKDVLINKTDVPTDVKVYVDQVHGFALRGDWSSDIDKKAMDDSLQQGVDWLKRYL